ncbi:hypothetical protein OHD62_23800 [Mesorhizobium sp. YC-39]|uniref:hypothetical protein n=1 Tax=unclassified Mesorhizobium TaxID=325217 RepID=UPI0021E72010|nr:MULTISPECIES: hypothetical protein [unclassified Mesorhizobium]MCV3209241.1 hypothetical protein [Mesorhizobium sp. YC-2]MCV3231409.1 hypothetical protein [Mesorhizobium sp. YC-39]
MARPATAAVRLLTGEREPVRLATTADIILNGLQTIDGVPAEIGDRVLVKDQDDPTQNGIYTASEGEWFRAADARTARTLQKGTTVHVQVGSANADRVFEFTVNEPVVGTDAIAVTAFLPPDILHVVDEVEALRDETQVLKDAVEASAGQAAASASASAANAGQTAADVITTAANLASAQAARDASLHGKGIFPTVATAIGLGVVGSGAITAGASGTNGTFDLAFAGGTGSGAAGRFVVAGGALTQILITAPGSYTVAPSFSFAASAGLTGASAAVVLGRNVDVGEYFWTEVSAGVLGLHNVTVGPAAVDTGIRAATAALIALIDSRTVGPTPLTGAGGVASGNVYYWPGSLAAVDEYVSALPVAMSALGTLRVVVSKVEGDGSLSDAGVPTQLVSAPAGVSTISGLDIYKPAGCVVGVQPAAGGSLYFTTGTIPNGEARWHTSTIPTSHTAKTITTNNGVQWQAVLVGEITAKARRADGSVAAIVETVGSAVDIGWPSLVNTGTDTPANYSVILQTPALADGYITEVGVGAAASGAANIHVVEIAAGPTVNVISTTAIVLSNGVASIPVAIALGAGQYPAISGGGYKYQANSNPLGIRAWVRSGALSNGAAVIDQASHRFEVSFTIKTGLVADVAVAKGGGAQNTGMNLLAGADPNGIVDATAIFAAAAAAHPQPYVPPGTFALTAIPATGNGLWGPGKPVVNGERFFIPPRPQLTNLYDGLRSALAEFITENDVLVLVGDSISHFGSTGLTSGSQHWFNMLIRFANLNIAADEPIMTALRPSSAYVPSFYGLTTTGTVSTGSTGPLGESLILASGAAMSFTGAYEQVDVFYEQAASAGSLSFQYNGGAAFKTVNAAGASTHDVYSGPTATGQAASGTYTITAAGSPVEITGLVRLGPKAAGSRPRLLTMRAAHGSYQFQSFNAARRASIIKQASAFGGKPVPIFALGINDQFGLAPTTIVANATAAINDFVAAGAPAMFAVPIWRITSSWDGSYSNGRTFDPAAGALRKLYRQNNIKMFGSDKLDWTNLGLLQDGLHLSVNGNDTMAQIGIETLD